MYRNNLKLAWRYLLKDRSFTLLNLLGLATGLACAIMIYLWVGDEAQVDTFNNKRVYQILKNAPSPTGLTTDDRTPGLLSATLAKELPDVAYATSVIPVSWFDRQGLLIYDDRRVTAKAAFAGADYFKIFSYHLISGHADDVLQDKQSVVVSNELALKLFAKNELDAWQQSEDVFQPSLRTHVRRGPAQPRPGRDHRTVLPQTSPGPCSIVRTPPNRRSSVWPEQRRAREN